MSATNGTDTVKSLIGKSVKRVEDKRFTTGRGKFTDDIVLPNQTYNVEIGLEEWVTTTGGGYFFAPSVSALQHLAT